MHPVERAAAVALRWLATGLGLSLPLIFVEGALLGRFVVQLGGLVGFGLGLGWTLAPLADSEWFTRIASARWRHFAAATAVIILVTGTVALVTLASSAALGFDPSLQFLQLLSALDIAWAATALLLGVRWLRHQRVGLVAAAGLGGVCVWSVWRYLVNVGFGPNGEWVVTRAGLMEYVLPYDMAAAVVAVLAIVAGIRRRQPTVQPSPQS